MLIALPPSSVSISPVQEVYGIGDTVTLTCTVIANVPDQCNTADIRWIGNDEDINVTEISPNTVDMAYIVSITHIL